MIRAIREYQTKIKLLQRADRFYYTPDVLDPYVYLGLHYIFGSSKPECTLFSKTFRQGIL
ncbi:hypothetical protein MCRY_21220 [Marivita cryptomonadis]|nr:hypothetical protein MCRY_21220 [Marivita cryptomonadis]